ncbi:MAG: hypothetical protein V4732_06620 [Pseudomonadota bacterium]
MTSENCFAAAMRAALRALPLLILYSEGINKQYFPIKPFGFWDSDSVKSHLLALMKFHCLGIFLVHEKLPSIKLLVDIANAIGDARYEADIACESAKKRTLSFSSIARSNAFTAANFSAFHSIDCNFSLFPCIDTALLDAQAEFVNSRELAAITAKQVAALYSAAVAASTSLAEGDGFKKERAEIIEAAVSVAAHTSARLNKLVSFALDVSTDLSLTADVSSAFAKVVAAGTVASEAFAAVALHAHALNLTFFNEALTTAISATENYECARLTTLACNVDFSVDMYVGIDPQVFDSVRNALNINFCTAFTEAADSAEAMVRALTLAAESSTHYDNVRSAFDNFRVRYERLYDLRPMTAERIYYGAWRATVIALDAFSTVEFYQGYLQRVASENTNNFNYRACICAMEAIVTASRAFNADVAAYSNYNIRAAREMFEQSVVEDVRFLETHNNSQLFEQPIWLALDSDVENKSELDAISEPDVNPKTMWKNMWQTFKQEALALDADFNMWLAWYDELFAGNPIDIEKLRSFLERSVDMKNT